MLDPRTLVVGVAVTDSASFLTPIGYPTNTMDCGPGYPVVLRAQASLDRQGGAADLGPARITRNCRIRC